MSSNGEVPSPTISIVDQDGTCLVYNVKPLIKLGKLFQDFCERKQLEYETVRFLYEGVRVSPRHTPRMLGMKGHVEIAALVSMSGGGGR